MILLTTHESHYLSYRGEYYDPANYTVGGFFDDMLAVYDRVIFAGRCKEVAERPQCMRVDSERVQFFPVRDFCGYTGFLSQAMAFWECRKTVGLADRYLLHCPGFVANMIGYWLRRNGQRYYVHIVGDPEDVAKAKTYQWPGFLSRRVSAYYKSKFQQFVRSSCGGLSVTEHYLRRKYPSGRPDKDAGVSDVRLPDDFFENPERDFRSGCLELIIVGILLKYKGHKTLFDALAKIKDQRDWRLNIVGDGPERNALQSQAERLGIADKVVFHGRKTWGPELFEMLKKAEMFVLSSLTEGMPRVLLEAMAKGLATVATDVGGVSEIVPEEVLVRPGDAADMAEKIASVWNSPERLRAFSLVNYDRIQDFRSARLGRLRREWFEWMKNDAVVK